MNNCDMNGTVRHHVTTENSQLPRPAAASAVMCQINDGIKRSPAEEKERLIHIVKELENMNISWQTYSAQQDAYVAMLVRDNENLRMQMRAQQQQQAHSQNENSGRLETALLHNQRLQDEVKQLHEALRVKDDQLKVKDAEIKVKDEQIRDFQNDTTILKSQLLTYVEDFESERKDRERAQSKLHDTESELELAKRQLQRYDLQQMHDISQRRAAALEYHRLEYERANPHRGQDIVQDGIEEDGDGEDELDSGVGMTSPTRVRQEFNLKDRHHVQLDTVSEKTENCEMENESGNEIEREQLSPGETQTSVETTDIDDTADEGYDII